MNQSGKNRIKMALIGLVALFLLATVAGFTYERLGRARDRKRVPPRVGRPVDIGGRALNISCSGDGSPAVILEAGGGHGGYPWILEQPRIAEFTKVCWYDRAGEGWSDPPPAPRTSSTIVSDLHLLLERAPVPAPYVLVGASIGGDYVRVFTAKYPADVSGLVLVDSSHPDQHEPPSQLAPVNRMPTSVRRLLCAVMPAMIRFGVVRLMMSREESVPPKLNPEQQKVIRGLRSQRIKEFETEGAQACAATNNGALRGDWGSGDPEVDNAARIAGNLGDRPLLVLTAGRYWTPSDPVAAREIADFHQVWVHQLQADLARLSTRGKQVVVENSEHAIGLEAPDAVVDAVRNMVMQIRSEQQ
jgi:pimeloyl-ACP methyl ester carboxylesterase